MKKLIVLAAISCLVLPTVATSAKADGCGSPFCSGGLFANPGPLGGPFGGLFAKSPMPAFQAAPWYSYWPYNSHFMTPAPMMSPYYAPPYVGAAYGGGGMPGMMVNPYFPAAPQAMPSR